MAAIRILNQFTPMEHEQTALAVTEVDLETADRWLEEMEAAADVLTGPGEFNRVARLT